MHPECHYKCPCKRKTEGDFTDKGEESNVIADADAAQLALKMEEGITSQGVQDYGYSHSLFDEYLKSFVS